METSNNTVTPESTTVDVEDPQFKVLRALVELNPQEPFSVGWLASNSRQPVKEVLVVLSSIAESDEGLLVASYLYRTETGHDIYDRDTAYRKIQAGELDLNKLTPRFETTTVFRQQIPSEER